MPTAYILVNCTMGAEEKIINEIAKLSDVKEVRGTYRNIEPYNNE
jgi:hypothetical protein